MGGYILTHKHLVPWLGFGSDVRVAPVPAVQLAWLLMLSVEHEMRIEAVSLGIRSR